MTMEVGTYCVDAAITPVEGVIANKNIMINITSFLILFIPFPLSFL